WTIHLAAGDSLLFGSRPSFKGERISLDQQGDLFEVSPIYAVEDPQSLREILGQGYHVVVGNPPYIIMRDRAINNAYRQLYSTCHQKYSLGVPFTQRFWELAIRPDESGTSPSSGGYIQGVRLCLGWLSGKGRWVERKDEHQRTPLAARGSRGR